MNPTHEIALVTRALQHKENTAILSPEGRFTYRDLLDASQQVAMALLDGKPDLEETRVAFLVTPGFDYVRLQWGTWRAGGVAVPLCTAHPAPELHYVLEDAAGDVVVADERYESLIRPLADELRIRFLSTAQIPGGSSSPTPRPDFNLPNVPQHRRAMIVYTSGTTSRPKGVVSTHGNIRAQIEALITAWGWRSTDHILNVLPLHHIHGIINVVSCALWSGATCEMAPRFDAATVWRTFERGDLTLFMAVPTVYSRLTSAWKSADTDQRSAWSEACSKLRLMVSGSAALPVHVLETWREITGHVLLERYGMTEIGMGLSNPLEGERVPGHVGRPLPTVEIRLVDENGPVTVDGLPGEIQVRGPSVFSEYWRRPEATREAFEDGWFRTGDVAVVEGDIYRILGRQSVDIIKTGGYKVSALEIEEVLRTHEDIEECAVVGRPDDDWGERVAAAIVPTDGRPLTLEQLRVWAKERLAAYKVPTELLLLDTLPRNALGKVTKPAVIKRFDE